MCGADKSDVLYAFVSMLAIAKVGLHLANKGFQSASKSHDAEAAQFLSKGAFAWVRFPPAYCLILVMFSMGIWTSKASFP